jgi:hypothetical protein
MRVLAGVLSVLVLVGLGFGQDQNQDRIDELIRQLGHDDYIVRERAEQELLKMGPEALPALRKCLEDGDAEVQERAERIIPVLEKEARIRKLIQPPPPITLKTSGTVADVVSRIEAAAKLRFNKTDLRDQMNEPVELDVTEASLFEVMDTLCRQLKGMTWQIGREQEIEFMRGPFVELPTCIDGPFRVRVVGLETYTKSSFGSKSSAFAITVLADALPGVALHLDPTVKITKILDDQGEPLTETNEQITLGQKQVSGNRSVTRAGQWPHDQTPKGRSFVYKAKRLVPSIKTIECVVDYYFRFPSKEFAFEMNGQAQTIKLEGVTISLPEIRNFDNQRIRQRTRYLTISVASESQDPSLAGVIGRLIEEGSFEAVMKDGKRQKVQATFMNRGSAIRMVNGRPVQAYPDQWRLMLNNVKLDQITKIAFKVSVMERKKVGFTFGEIPLK